MQLSVSGGRHLQESECSEAVNVNIRAFISGENLGGAHEVFDCGPTHPASRALSRVAIPAPRHQVPDLKAVTKTGRPIDLR